MEIRLIVGQYKQGYPGELMPNVLAAWDEYVLEDNYEGFDRELTGYREQVGTDFESVAVVRIDVPDHSIAKALMPPVIKVLATVVE